MIEASNKEDTTDESQMICGCFDFTIADIHRTLDENPDLKFQEFLDYANIGNKCTACLLDLEYHFVDHGKHKHAAPKSSSRKAKHKSVPQKSLKQSLYGFLDALSPDVAYPFDNPMPVLYGPGIEQWVQIVNLSMLFEKKVYAPDLDISLTLRDGSGQVVYTANEILKADGQLRASLSAALARANPLEKDQDIGIGWVAVERRGKTPGVRGTTRPQVEIITPSGSCAVHSQAESPPASYGFSALCRPRDERLFISFINTRKRPLTVKLSYPFFMSPESEDSFSQEETLMLRPYSVTLHEFNLDRFMNTPHENALMGLRWVTDGPFKAHIFCATKSLDRFSIDHV